MTTKPSFVRALLAGGLLLFLSGCNFFFFWWTPQISNAKQAGQLRAEGKHDEAVAAYRKHISARLKDSRREPDENPYFYEILIGDTFLEKGDADAALESYLSAKQHEVESPLVGDRIRRIARFYRDKGEYRRGLDLLHQYREMDDFGFDSDIDELAKLLMKAEEGTATGR